MTVSKALRDDLLASIPNLRAFAVSLAGSSERADDLVQETLMKAWAKFDTFQEGTNLRAWLFTILRNEFYSQVRKRGREVEDAEGTYAARLASQPAQIGHMDMSDFREALAQLPADQREALILRRRLRLLLRGGGGDLRMRRRHHQEPRQPRAHAARRAAAARSGRDLRRRSDVGERHHPHASPERGRRPSRGAELPVLIPKRACGSRRGSARRRPASP